MIETDNKPLCSSFDDICEIPGEEAAITIKKLNVWYGQNQALYNVNMIIPKNKITAFIGPSGCGKTTLLKCLNRMNDLINCFRLEGEIIIDGQELYDPSVDVVEARKKTGMVFQQPNPFPTTIYKNLSLPLKENFPSINKKRIDEIVEQKLKAAYLFEEVKDRLNKSALRLSGGQQQRLCIARALTIEPEIILLDEPCSALDHISTMKIEELLEELKQKYTIVIVTHNLQQAARIADYVAFFYNGKVEEYSTAQDIFTNPQSTITHNYINGLF